jgi:large subunit ribosomal protein L4
MPQVAVRGSSGDVVEQIELSDHVFSQAPHRGAVYAAVQRQLANSRAGTAETLTRGMVSGGGKKPWRQKGTGRARQGSTRAPQWRHGGVVWGPHPRKYTQDLPRKVRRLALRAAISEKLAEQKLVIVDRFTFAKPSTKEFKAQLTALGVTGKALIVMEPIQETVYLSARNLPKVTMLPAQSLDVINILKAEFLLMDRAAAKVVEGLFQ